MLCRFELGGQDLSKLINVDLAVRAVSDDTHQSRLQRLNVTSLGHQSLQVVIDARLLGL